MTLNLVASVALPCLLYAVESMQLNNVSIKCLEHPWTRVFMKVFTTFDNNTVRQCQIFTGFLSIEQMIWLRQINFNKSLESSSNSVMQVMYRHAAAREIRPIAERYQVDSATLLRNYRSIICHERS